MRGRLFATLSSGLIPTSFRCGWSEARAGAGAAALSPPRSVGTMVRGTHPALTRAHLALSFRLETFGGLALMDSAGAVVSTQRRRLALLALIAAAGRRGISRDKALV